MTQEEKELLLKDLCGRLPYGFIVHRYSDNCNITFGANKIDDFAHFFEYSEEEKFKPYLRPMSSMTEEERKELSDYLCEQVMSNKIGITIPPNPTQGKGIPFIWMGDCLDWLNKNKFDYRGLIPMGLALEAPEDMYK